MFPVDVISPVAVILSEVIILDVVFIGELNFTDDPDICVTVSSLPTLVKLLPPLKVSLLLALITTVSLAKLTSVFISLVWRILLIDSI